MYTYKVPGIGLIPLDSEVKKIDQNCFSDKPNWYKIY